MKYSITYRITAVLLASLVLFSSLSFSVEKHFCEGEMSSSFFKEAVEMCEMQSPECHSMESATSCCSTANEDANCCIDSSEFIEGISIEERGRSEQRITPRPIVVLISTFFEKNLLTKSTNFLVFRNTTTVLMSLDIGLLFQVFRI